MLLQPGALAEGAGQKPALTEIHRDGAAAAGQPRTGPGRREAKSAFQRAYALSPGATVLTQSLPRRLFVLLARIIPAGQLRLRAGRCVAAVRAGGAAAGRRSREGEPGSWRRLAQVRALKCLFPK